MFCDTMVMGNGVMVVVVVFWRVVLVWCFVGWCVVVLCGGAMVVVCSGVVVLACASCMV